MLCPRGFRGLPNGKEQSAIGVEVGLLGNNGGAARTGWIHSCGQEEGNWEGLMWNTGSLRKAGYEKRWIEGIIRGECCWREVCKELIYTEWLMPADRQNTRKRGLKYRRKDDTIGKSCNREVCECKALQDYIDSSDHHLKYIVKSHTFNSLVANTLRIRVGWCRRALGSTAST